MNCRIKIPWTPSVLSRSMSAGRTKKKDHYQSLEVDEKATQSEIKSAYFKLSMMYHPDKNSSEDAKVKFRDISEAYEVLGNYDKRRQYDRGMQIRSGGYSDARKSEEIRPQDIKKEAYRARAAVYRSAESASMGKMYDFDTWTKAHYGHSFRNSQKAKFELNERMADREKMMASKAKTGHEVSILAGIICIVAIAITMSTNSDFDKPSVYDSGAAIDDTTKRTN